MLHNLHQIITTAVRSNEGRVCGIMLIQFNMHSLTCRLNSTKADYKASTKTQIQNKYNTKKAYKYTKRENNTHETKHSSSKKRAI